MTISINGELSEGVNFRPAGGLPEFGSLVSVAATSARHLSHERLGRWIYRAEPQRPEGLAHALERLRLEDPDLTGRVMWRADCPQPRP